MHNLWFNNHPANKKFSSSVKATFLDGGYYKADVSDRLSILSLNTLEYNKG